MPQAKQGDKVRVHYTGKLPDGTVFDTSIQGEPLEFTVGQKQVIPGFEKAVVGMNPGETKQTELTADQAYGPHLQEKVAVVERGDLPADVEPTVGQQLQVHRADGQVIPARITDVSDSNVTLDANHPLAGRDLAFDLQLLEVV